MDQLIEWINKELAIRGWSLRELARRAKERVVPISADTADAIWHYLAVRPDARPQFIDRVFLTSEGRSMERNAVGKVLARLGKRVGVQANPHKFRHTGATQFLRNGGNAFTLKEILGHSTMAMVERYVHLAQVDIEEAHRRASPVFNWDLRR